MRTGTPHAAYRLNVDTAAVIVAGTMGLSCPGGSFGMHVRLLLFAAFREMLGTSELFLDLPPGSTADAAFEVLAIREPALRPLRKYATFAVNREVVDAGSPLHDGDEIALLQPMSGGSHD